MITFNPGMSNVWISEWFIWEELVIEGKVDITMIFIPGMSNVNVSEWLIWEELVIPSELNGEEYGTFWPIYCEKMWGTDDVVG